jgi:hypothetical protein
MEDRRTWHSIKSAVRGPCSIWADVHRVHASREAVPYPGHAAAKLASTQRASPCSPGSPHSGHLASKVTTSGCRIVVRAALDVAMFPQQRKRGVASANAVLLPFPTFNNHEHHKHRDAGLLPTVKLALPSVHLTDLEAHKDSR